MTLCIAAVCQDRGRDRIVIATDWKAGNDMAAAENEDKLYWITDNMPVMIAGTVTRAVDLKNTYAQWFMEHAEPATIRVEKISDNLREPLAEFRRKLADEHLTCKFQLSHQGFLEAVGKRQIPESIASEAFSDLGKLDIESELIMCFFSNEGTAFVYKVDDHGLELCNNFAAIGSGSIIAEGALYQREQDYRDTVGTTLYNVYEAMKLGSISPTVGEEHTLNLLKAPSKKGETVKSTMADTSTATDRLLEKKFRKHGPKPMRGMSLPKGAFVPAE